MTDQANEEIVVDGAERDPNELFLTLDGVDYSGWEEIAVTLRAEGFPNSFEISASVDPDGGVPAREGDDCKVHLGNDLVITGYVDRVINGGDANNHRVAITGRGLTQDLVDCGAEWPSHQMIGGNALTIAQNLAKPYNLKVMMANGATPGPDVPSWPLNYGETGAEIIQRVARNAGLLAYEDPEGNLLLANVGSVTAGSGAVLGQNIEEWSLERSMDQRYSEYICSLLSMDPFMEAPGSDFFGIQNDPGVNRHRRMYLVADAVAENPTAFVERRAKWEAARRAGRSYVCKATVDSWRDKAGKLWMPNTLIPFSIPGAADRNDLILSSVMFRRDNQRGTTAEIMAMPSTAFTPEPIVLTPVSAAEIIGPGNPGNPQ